MSINAIWLASACAVSYAWKAIWLADTCIASRKVEHSSTLAKAWNATQGNPTEPQFSSAKDDVNLDESTHSNVYVWMAGCRAFTPLRWNGLNHQGWRIPIHFEWGDVILCRTELWLRWVPVRCVSCFACSKSWRMFNFSWGNACVSQSNCLSCITDRTGTSQSDPVYAHV